MRYRMVLDTCDTVIHEKVAYPNRYGITIAADMFLPKDIDKSKKYAAIIFGTPYGGVKEQGQVSTRKPWQKEPYIIPGARHIDLYDRSDLIPFDKLIFFFTTSLK